MIISARSLSGDHLGRMVTFDARGTKSGFLDHVAHFRTGLEPTKVMILSPDRSFVIGPYALPSEAQIEVDE